MKTSHYHKHIINVVEKEKILFCEAQGGLTKILFTDNEEIILHKRFKGVQNELSEMDFFRCHDSFIVNMNFVKQIANNVCKLKITNNTISVSRRKKAEFKQKLKERKIIFL